MDIQKDLPNTPAEIIEKWLAPIACKDDYGWPPTEYNAWHYILENNSTLGYLRGLQWKKTKIALSPDLIIKKDMDAIRDIFQTHVVGVSTSQTAAKPEDYDYFRSHCDHMKESGIFSEPVILEETDAGFHILDGFYRICAFFYLYGHLQFENTEVRATNVSANQEIWLGKIS